MGSHNITIDALKGIAIIAIVLFHAGMLKYGFLGVEVFFTIGGFLITKSITRKFKDNTFRYTDFLTNRLIRLWPLALIVCIISGLLGYFFQLPSNYKNTLETIVGSCWFLNNFVQYITASNYWDSANEYKLLMHTWYIGVLLQFYILYPIIFGICKKIFYDWERALYLSLIMISLCSLAIYLCSPFSDAFNFYMLPSHIFEFTIGGIIALPHNGIKNKNKTLSVILLVVLIGIMTINANIDHNKTKLIATILITSLLLCVVQNTICFNSNLFAKGISKAGIASYSIYLWHQLIFSFYKYIINDHLSYIEHIALISVSFLLGLLSYYFIEQKIAKFCKERIYKNITLCSCLITAIALSCIATKFYLVHGVMRDIPELGIKKSDPTTWEPQAYNEYVHNFDKDFPINKKKNILVIGDSYARDWFNILQEAGLHKRYNISYRYSSDEVLHKRIIKADYIFLPHMAITKNIFNTSHQCLQRLFFV